jgi:hypothetical protein
LFFKVAIQFRVRATGLPIDSASDYCRINTLTGKRKADVEIQTEMRKSNQAGFDARSKAAESLLLSRFSNTTNSVSLGSEVGIEEFRKALIGISREF